MQLFTSKASVHKYARVLTLNVHTRISVLSFSFFPVLIYSCTLIYLLLGFFSEHKRAVTPPQPDLKGRGVVAEATHFI